MKRSVFIIIFEVFLLCSAIAIGTHEALPQTQEINKIVSLVPSVTETIFALGAENKLVARTDYCTWPKEAVAIPSVAGFDGKSISLEKIISFQPDLVCVASVMHDHLVEPLKQYGIKVFVSNANSISSVKEEILQLAKYTDCEQKGKELIEKIDFQLQEAQKIAMNKNVPSVYWEVSASPYFTCGKNSFISEVIEKAGGKNIFGDIQQAYPQVSEESIIALSPEIILFPDYTKTADINFFLERKNWQEIPAIKDKKIIPVEADMFSRPGPRIGQMILELAQIMHLQPTE